MANVKVRWRELQHELGLVNDSDIIYTDKIYTRDWVRDTFKTGIESGPRSVEQYYINPDGVCDCCGRTLNQYIDDYGLCRKCDEHYFKNKREEQFQEYMRHKYAKKAVVESRDVTNTKQVTSFTSIDAYMDYKHANLVNHILAQPEFKQKPRRQVIDEMYEMDYATYKHYAERPEHIESIESKTRFSVQDLML